MKEVIGRLLSFDSRSFHLLKRRKQSTGRPTNVEEKTRKN